MFWRAEEGSGKAPLPTCLTVNFGREFGEVSQDFGHFVSSLSAADVDDDVGVGKLGKRLRNDGFATTESTGDGCGSTLNAGEQSIKYTLA